jgi:3-hydroxyacyl-CoA dehydrogenase
MMNINAVATLERDGRIAVLTINSPPVNALGALVRQGIAQGLEEALGDDSIGAVVLICAGRTFFAGADIGEFGKPPQQPDLNSLVSRIDLARKPVIAAIHGTALGGGLELALACHARLADVSAKLGLPEVNLGLLPGAGGTQRLPRLLGVGPALEMMLTGKPVSAAAASENGLIDAIVDTGTLRDGAVKFAGRWLLENRPLRRLSQSDAKVAAARCDSEVIDRIKEKHARLFRGFKAPASIVQAVQAAVNLPFEEGMARERQLFLSLLTSPESAAQRYAFFAEREAARIPGLSVETPTIDVKRIGIIGAGTMGGGIAMNFLDIGMPVTLVERERDALDRGIATIRRNYEASASKGRIRSEDVESRMALLTPSLDIQDLSLHELVIEAVFENLELKKQIFRQLDAVAAPNAILASNTSFLDLDALASATSRADHVIGLHFFSPANVMRLLEIVRGARSTPTAVATALRLARRINKVAVVSGVCSGFIANRVMSRRTVQASALILEGPMPWDIDRVVCDFGFAMGPFAMMDLVGIEVVGWNKEASCGSTIQELLCERDRWGIKRGAGYYDYDEQKRARPAAVVETLIREFSMRVGTVRGPVSDAAILERLLFPVVNEGAKVLEEGIAIRASDIDIALITGYGWPVYTGGPMYWAETLGLDRVVGSLRDLQERHGESFKPCALLERLASEKKSFRDL